MARPAMETFEDRPTVLIVGGFMTLPANYWPMRRRLLRRGAGLVRIAPIWPVDWALAAVLGFGPVMTRTRRAIIEARRAAGKAPIIVVAHSGGGIAARLALSEVPYHGRRGGVADAVGCLVTLGTPHVLSGLPNRYRHSGHEAAEFLDRESPGAAFAPRTAYLSVGSAYPMAGFPGPLGRAAQEVFSILVGNDTAALGDGIVPASAVHLEGAEQITYDDARHGHIGAHWYGAEEVVDRWWPRAVELWCGALAERRSPSVIAPADEPSGNGRVGAGSGAKPSRTDAAPRSAEPAWAAQTDLRRTIDRPER